jgi:hypothetical protein
MDSDTVIIVQTYTSWNSSSRQTDWYVNTCITNLLFDYSQQVYTVVFLRAHPTDKKKQKKKEENIGKGDISGSTRLEWLRRRRLGQSYNITLHDS